MSSGRVACHPRLGTPAPAPGHGPAATATHHTSWRIRVTSPTHTRRDGTTAGARPTVDRASRRLTTETKAAFKTTEFFAFLAAVAGVLIAAAVVDETDAGGFGARQAWLYVTILAVGYRVSRGRAKSGSRDPYDADDR